jgi:hypothetical protein
MSRCNIRERLSGLEGGNEGSLLVRRPITPNIVWKLRASLGTSADLFEGGDACQQRPQHVRLLQHRAGR